MLNNYGWMPDLPDYRDYTDESKEVKLILGNTLLKGALPRKIDLSRWCSPIENQGSIGSCSAHAGVALFEYFQRKSFGKHIDGSRLFLYKTTRNLLHLKGDAGAYLRGTMGAMALCGICPEEHWRYDISKFDEEPSNFAYSLAKEYQATKYYRLDPRGINNYNLLNKIKNHLASKLPSMFGFSVFNSIKDSQRSGNIQMPSRGDSITGGHAVVAIGYDDDIVIKNRDESKSVGAIKIRNS